jgi:TetR/AcrR family transcriptional regulator, cholesterol catabolism regulator
MNVDPKEFRERRIKDAKCALILDAARKLFAEKGYWETRLEDIAAFAGFSKASLYNYYLDKESIFLSLAINENEEFLEKIRAVLENGSGFSKTLAAMLKIVFTGIQEDYGVMVNAVTLQTMVAAHATMLKHGDLIERFIASVNQFVGLIEALVGRSRRAGEICCELDDAALAGFIGTLVRGAIFDWNVSKRRQTVESVVDRIVTFIRQGAGVTKKGSMERADMKGQK